MAARNLRIGSGYDVHRLVEGRRLVLGGIDIPFAMGLLGHSDADVLIHAICDALLGAAALGDIGGHFPDTAEEYKDIDSQRLLEKVKLLLRDEGWSIINIDCTIIAQRPRLAAYIPAMRIKLAQTLTIEAEQISIKATTTEGLGFAGRGEGIASQAIALIEATR